MVRSFYDVVAWFDLDSDRVFRQDLDENLHSASQAKNKVKYWLFLDVVVAQSCFPAKMSRCWRPRGMPSLSWMFLFTFKYCLLVQPQQYWSFQLGSSRRTAWCFETCIVFQEITDKNFLSSKSENAMASKGTGAIHRSSWRSVVAFYASPFSVLCFPQLSAKFLRYSARLFSVTWKKELYYSSKPIRLQGFCGALIPCLIDCWRGSLSMLKGPVRYGRSRWQKDALLDWIAPWLFDRFIANRIGDFFKELTKNKEEWHKN